ncbi:MAG: hypothetical protein ACFFAE_21470, partial [Candidatus Hodarchaeota archaeon]
MTTNVIIAKDTTVNAMKNNALLFILILWVIPLVISSIINLNLFKTVWYPLGYLIIPFGSVYLLMKIFPKRDDTNLWDNQLPKKEKKFVFFIFLFTFFVVGFLLIINVIVGLISIMVLTKKGYFPKKNPETNRWREYFTRLDIYQLITLVFVFIILPLSSLYRKEGSRSLYSRGPIFGYLGILLFLGALMILANIKNEQIGIRIDNLFISFVIIFISMSGHLGEILYGLFTEILVYAPEKPVTELIYYYFIVGFAEEFLWRVLIQTYFERKYNQQIS